jgi:uncharacterized membrane protein HdeD (DUF308 family)
MSGKEIVMISLRMQGSQKVSNLMVVCASFMLVGIIVLGLGFVQTDRLILYAGLILTVAGVLTGIVTLVSSRHMRNRKT